MSAPLVSLELRTTRGVLTARTGEHTVYGGTKLLAIDGWYGGVSISSESTDRLGFGEFLSLGRGSARTLTLRVSLYSEDQNLLRAFKRAWSGAFSDGEAAELVVDWDGLVLSSSVVQDGEASIPDAGHNRATVQLPLRASDPCLYSPDRTTFLYPQGTGVGLEFNLFGGEVPALVPGQNMSLNPNLDSLSPILGPGTITAGGGSAVAVDGAGGLSVSAGSSTASSAYIIPRRTALAEWGGRFVTLTGTVHLDAPQPEGVDTVGITNSNPPRALNIGAEYAMDGSTPWWAYANSDCAPNVAGDHTVSVSTILPDSTMGYPGWFARAFNGSTQTGVTWKNISITAQDTVKVSPVSHTVLDIQNPSKVAQSFAIDEATGEYYVGQPRTGDVDAYIYRVSPTGELLGTMFMAEGGHVNCLAVERDGDDVWVWYWWPAHANGAVRIKWRDGNVSATSSDVQALPKYGDLPVLYSLRDDTVCTYEEPSPRHCTFRLYDKTEFLSGDATPTQVLELPRIGQAYQGHAHTAEHLYMHAGGSQGDAVGAFRYAWTGGDPVVVRTNSLGEARHEAEGIQVRETEGGVLVTLGLSTGEAYERVAHVMDVDGAVFDEAPPSGGKPAVLWFGSAVDTRETITNAGNADAYPTFLVVGDFPGGVSIAPGAGAGALEYPWPITRQAPLQIESSGSAWVGNTNVTSRMTKRNFDRFKLGPGKTMAPTVRGLQGAEGYVEVHTSDAYL